MSEEKDKFLVLKENIINKVFEYDGKEFFCVDCKLIGNRNLAIYTNTRTIVLFFRDEINKINIVENADETAVIKMENRPKIDIFESEPIRNNIIPKFNSPKVRMKIPLSSEMKEYLKNKFKNLPQSLEERPWTDEEESVVFRDSTRIMSILLNRSTYTINLIKKQLRETDAKNGIDDVLAQINKKKLNTSQIEHFTEKYSKLPQDLRERPWTDEEDSLLFRETPLKISQILNRPVYMIYKKRTDYLKKIEKLNKESDLLCTA